MMASVSKSSSSDPKKHACMYYASIVLLVVCAIGCCVVYALGSIRRIFHIFYLSGYGIMSLVYYISTSLFSVMNKRSVENKSSESKEDTIAWTPSVGVHVVGYREDPDYYRKCLESVLNMDYPNVKVICVVIDGNEEGDMYMVDIAKEVFGSNSRVINFLDDPRENYGNNMMGDIESTSPPSSPSMPTAGSRFPSTEPKVSYCFFGSSFPIYSMRTH